MALIAVDVDDTLYSFAQLARNTWVDYALENGTDLRGAYCAWVEWRSPADVISLDQWLTIIDLCHQPNVIREQTPFPGAVATLWELADQGHELIYISHRAEAAVEPTEDWLYDNHFPYCDNLVCTSKDKNLFLREAQYMIDDRPKNVVEFVYDHQWHMSRQRQLPEERPRKAFGLLGDYNRALTDIPNVYLAPNWKLMRQYMIEHGVLDAASIAS